MARRTVEECLRLDVFSLAKEGVLAPEVRSWVRFRRHGLEVAWVALRAEPRWLEVREMQTPFLSTTSHPRIGLEWQETSFGAKRVQFRCPQCDKPRGKLYLPPG